MGRFTAVGESHRLARWDERDESPARPLRRGAVPRLSEWDACHLLQGLEFQARQIVSGCGADGEVKLGYYFHRFAVEGSFEVASPRNGGMKN